MGAELFPADGAVVCVTGASGQPVSCVDVETGDLRWSADSGYPIAAASADGRLAVLAQSERSTDLALSLFDMQTGQAEATIPVTLQNAPDFTQGTNLQCRMCFSNDGLNVFIAWHGHVARIDTKNATVDSSNHAAVLPTIQSIDYVCDRLVVCSYENDTPEQTATAIEVVNKNLQEQWSLPQTQPTRSIENGTACSCAPTFLRSESIESLGGTARDNDTDSQAFLFAASNGVVIVDASTGSTITTISGDAPVVCTAGGPAITVAYANGAIKAYSKPLSERYRETDSLTTQVSDQFYAARASGDSLLVLQSATEPGALKCYTRCENRSLPNVHSIDRSSADWMSTGKIADPTRTTFSLCQSCDYSTLAFLHGMQLVYVNSDELGSDTRTRQSIDLADLPIFGQDEYAVQLRFSCTDPSLVYLLATKTTGDAPAQLWAIDLARESIVGSTEFSEIANPEAAQLMLWFDAATPDALCTGLSGGIAVRDPRTLAITRKVRPPDANAAVGYAAVGKSATLVVELPWQKSEATGGIAFDTNWRVALVDNETGKRIDSPFDGYTLRPQSRIPETVQVDPMGEYALLACDDGMLRCCSLSAGELLWEMPFKAGSSDGLHCSDDGKRVFVRNDANTLSILDAKTGETIAAGSTAPGAVRSIRESADGNRWYLITQENSYAPSLLQVLVEREGSLEVESEVDYALALSQDESRIVACDSLGEFNIPRYSLDELIARGHEELAQRDQPEA